MNNRKFKNLIINKKFQVRYLLWIIIPSLLVAISYSTLFYYFISENYQVLVDLNPVMTDEVKSILYEELHQLFLMIFMISSLFILLIFIIALFNSNKTAGPLYRFKMEFDKIKNGKTVTVIKLRPGDDFHDVAESFNEMMNALELKNQKQP